MKLSYKICLLFGCLLFAYSKSGAQESESSASFSVASPSNFRRLFLTIAMFRWKSPSTSSQRESIDGTRTMKPSRFGLAKHGTISRILGMRHDHVLLS
jgi:hypothetical protein